MSRARILVPAAIVGALLAPGASGLPAASADTITVGQAASGSCRGLERGDLLVVRLETNPSTGYAWRLRSSTRPVVVLVARSYLPPREDLLGAPGTAVFRFRARSSGRTVVRLAYARPWEPGGAPARTFTIRVWVS